MLRNLAPDHTLVLVNGKRRHRSSIIDWHGGNGVAFGSQGSDISAIPAIALRQVEVLRDGAAAQYGSDAIAGVLNFQLKDAASGGAIEYHTGTFGAGDGEAMTVAANVGLPLGATGFANLSLEYGGSNPTNRSAPRSDAIALIAAGNTDVASDTPQIWGSPDIDDDLKLFGNFGYTSTAGVQVYSHTNYASKRVTGGFFFRNPNTRGGVFSGDGGETLLIGDVLRAHETGSANCPTVAITDNVADPVALQQVFDDPNCFSFRERFPGGFTPNFGGEAQDMSFVGGIRGLRHRRLHLGHERIARRPRDRPLHHRHRQRLARPRHAHLVQARQQPAAGGRAPRRRVLRRHRHDQHRGRRGMAERAVRDPRGGSRGVDGRPLWPGTGILRRLQRILRLRADGCGHLEPGATSRSTATSS